MTDASADQSWSELATLAWIASRDIAIVTEAQRAVSRAHQIELQDRSVAHTVAWAMIEVRCSETCTSCVQHCQCWQNAINELLGAARNGKGGLLPSARRDLRSPMKAVPAASFGGNVSPGPNTDNTDYGVLSHFIGLEFSREKVMERWPPLKAITPINISVKRRQTGDIAKWAKDAIKRGVKVRDLCTDARQYFNDSTCPSRTQLRDAYRQECGAQGILIGRGRPSRNLENRGI